MWSQCVWLMRMWAWPRPDGDDVARVRNHDSGTLSQARGDLVISRPLAPSDAALELLDPREVLAARVGHVQDVELLLREAHAAVAVGGVTAGVAAGQVL